MSLRSTVVLFLTVLSMFLTTGVFAAERLVYPQAVVGPVGAESFDIEVFLGNRNSEEAWIGVIRLLESDQLNGFSTVTFTDEEGKQTTVNSGQQSVSIPAGGSRYYRIKSATLQVGVMVIETDSSKIDDLVPSFFYKLLDQGGTVIDVVGVVGVREAATGFRVMITETGTSSVGVAMVSANGVEQASGPATLNKVDVTFTALLADGSEVSGTVSLGGNDAGHKALFPFQVIPDFPTGVRVAQLKIRSTEKVYVTTLALVTPAESQDFQYGAAPALIDMDVPATGLSVDTQDREAVVEFFHTVHRASDEVDAKFSGDVSACDPGNTSAVFKEAMLRRINWYRAMAGMPGDITLDDELNLKCQAAALIMAAQQQLSHSPPSSWPCYTSEGAEAAQKSNLHLGFNSSPSAGVVDGFIQDSGNGNHAVGHRRWLLYPRQRTMGTGSVQSSTIRANAVWVLGDFGSGPNLNSSWPPAGFVPYQTVFPRWSFSSPNADFSQATVTMTQNGSTLQLTVLPLVVGFGDNTIVWEPSGIPSTAPSADTSYDVTVSNVLVGGSPTQFTYTVTVIDPDN